MSDNQADSHLALHEFYRGDRSKMPPTVASRYPDQDAVYSALAGKKQATWDQLAGLVKMDPARLCVAVIRLSKLGALRVDVKLDASSIYLTPRFRRLIGVPEPQATL